MSLAEGLAEAITEDRAIDFLAAFPSRVAAVMALKAAGGLRIAWEIEQVNMLRRNDPRPVYLSTEEDRCWLAKAAAKYSEDPLWHVPLDTSFCSLFATLPPDAAAFVAYKVAKWAWGYDGGTFG